VAALNTEAVDPSTPSDHARYISLHISCILLVLFNISFVVTNKCW
jgi:hypothetical protein